MFGRIKQSVILFWLSVGGIVFYVVQPILFPEVPSHPELLPIYTLMMGLGRAVKKNEDKDKDDENNGEHE